VGDFNFKLGDRSALRLGTMVTKADNNGAGSSLDKTGLAGTLRWGIGERDEFSSAGYHLDNNNGMNYGMPWIRPTRPPRRHAPETSRCCRSTPAYYGMASDRNAGQAETLTGQHVHRFDRSTSSTPRCATARYERDQRAGTVRFAMPRCSPVAWPCPGDLRPRRVITRGTQLKIQDLDTWFAQSDYSGKFTRLGLRHEVMAGVDLARRKDRLRRAQRGPGRRGAGQADHHRRHPDDGAWIDESVRVLRTSNQY
jgi:catecholate siderophore receptor